MSNEHDAYAAQVAAMPKETTWKSTPDKWARFRDRQKAAILAERDALRLQVGVLVEERDALRADNRTLAAALRIAHGGAADPVAALSVDVDDAPDAFEQV